MRGEGEIGGDWHRGVRVGGWEGGAAVRRPRLTRPAVAPSPQLCGILLAAGSEITALRRFAPRESQPDPHVTNAPRACGSKKKGVVQPPAKPLTPERLCRRTKKMKVEKLSHDAATTLAAQKCCAHPASGASSARPAEQQKPRQRGPLIPKKCIRLAARHASCAASVCVAEAAQPRTARLRDRSLENATREISSLKPRALRGKLGPTLCLRSRLQTPAPSFSAGVPRRRCTRKTKGC